MYLRIIEGCTKKGVLQDNVMFTYFVTAENRTKLSLLVTILEHNTCPRSPVDTHRLYKAVFGNPSSGLPAL